MQLKQLDMDSEAQKDDKGCEWSPGDDLANGEWPGTVIPPEDHVMVCLWLVIEGTRGIHAYRAGCGLRGCLPESSNTKYP